MSSVGGTSGPSVGIVGLGAVGSAIAERLLASGRRVIGFDPAEPARRDLERLGGTAARDPAELAELAAAVLLVVPDSSEIESAVLGERGLARGLSPGSWVAILSTVDPSTPQGLAERLAPQGVQVVDAPLSGGPERARRGELAFMVGGAEEAFAAAVTVLREVGDPVIHVGPIGHGEIAKLANNLAGAVITQGLAEALSLAAKAGADVERVAEAMSAASGSSWVLREWLPSTTFAGDYSPRFRLGLMRKDLGLIRDLASANDVQVPVLERCSELFAEAAEAGLEDRDFSAIIDLHARRSGTSVGPPDALGLEPD